MQLPSTTTVSREGHALLNRWWSRSPCSSQPLAVEKQLLNRWQSRSRHAACLAMSCRAATCKLRFSKKRGHAPIHMPPMAQAKQVLEFLQIFEKFFDRHSKRECHFTRPGDQVEGIGRVTARSPHILPEQTQAQILCLVFGSSWGQSLVT